MTQTQGVDDFFDNSVRSGAPSAKLSGIGDWVKGEIVDQFKVERKDFATGEVMLDKKTQKPMEQLVVVLQTDLRGWQGVSKIPTVDPTDKRSPQKDPSEDDGRRAVYVAPFTNIHGAIGRATAVHNGGRPTGLRNGGILGVKVVDLEDTGKGNPKKVHEAYYELPTASASGDFFGPSNTGAQPAQQAPAAQQAQPAQQAPAAQQAPTQHQDPWGSQASNVGAAPF